MRDKDASSGKLKLFQVSIEVNIHSIGRIAEHIGVRAMERGWESYISYSRYKAPSASHTVKTDSKIEIYHHVLMTRLFDRHCLHSSGATRRLVERIAAVNPDVIHLHNIHGYYIDMRVLFDYLSKSGKPVVWTLHDCWSFTGHCAFVRYGDDECVRWQSGCHDCPKKRIYPASFFADRSRKNYELKKVLFNSVPNLTLVPVSEWLLGKVKESFLGYHRALCIHNGIDTEVFCPQPNRSEICRRFGIDEGKPYILGIASVWDGRKGLSDFVKLQELHGSDLQTVLVGLRRSQMKTLPDGIIGIERTDDAHALSGLYSGACVLVNPTYNDTFPTVNIEAQACGTPVVTYDTDGSPETISEGDTGFVTRRGDVSALADGVRKVISLNADGMMSEKCRLRAVEHFDYRRNFEKYVDLYELLLGLNS